MRRGTGCKIAESLGYVPNRLAAAFGADQAGTLVGMCVPRLTSGLFGHVLDGVDRALSRLGYQLMIGANNHAPEEEEPGCGR
jgi:LacI family transcriptional regulator, gluconate utilization system Gnt-I transcriptional repressor